tara:strand:+ start:284 stop:505 length:222 start_codon:yes stop_codon:yes gene_type:complete
MALILTIDSLGKRYGMLPSEVLSRSNTFDLYIMDAALTFENYHHKKASNNGREPIPDFTTDELQQLLDKSKEQ